MLLAVTQRAVSIGFLVDLVNHLMISNRLPVLLAGVGTVCMECLAVIGFNEQVFKDLRIVDGRIADAIGLNEFVFVTDFQVVLIPIIGKPIFFGPARIGIFLAFLVGGLFPFGRRLPGFNRLVFTAGIALAGNVNNAGIGQLSLVGNQSMAG